MTATSERQRIIFLDVDGTIVEHGRFIPASAIDAIQRARANGHLVFLCTGRSAADLDRRLLDVGFDGAITNGGCHAVIDGEVVVARLLSVDALAQLQETFEAHGVHWFLQGHDEMYASPGLEALREGMREKLHGQSPGRTGQGWIELHGDGIVPLGRVADADPAQIAKTVILSDDEDAVDRVLREVDGKFMHVTGTIPVPMGKSAEIATLGVTKGATIVELVEHLGLDMADTIGIGDSFNDVEMFEVCGLSIAMGNGAPEVQRLADEITAPLDEDGLSKAFARHGLI